MRPIVERMLAVFDAEAKKRPQRERTVYVDGRRTMEWIALERKAMGEAVNAERARFGKAPVDAAKILRAENAADGHSDYAVKFALGCAGLVEAP